MLTTLDMHQIYCRINPKNDLELVHSIHGTRFSHPYSTVRIPATAVESRFISLKIRTNTAFFQCESMPS